MKLMSEIQPVIEIQFSDDEGRTESLPAESLGSGLYRMRHIPSYAYSISLGDIFKVIENERGDLLFGELVEKSGNQTVRVLLTRFSISSPEIVAILEKVVELGCSYENLLPHMVCINVPLGVEIATLKEFLIEQHVWWEFADPDIR